MKQSEEDLQICQIDLDLVKKVRTNMQCFQHLRTDLY
jgi:hypothetical protein